MKVIEEEYIPKHIYVVETPTCFHCKEVGNVVVQAQELFFFNQGMHIQDAFKSLGKELREQLISGTHPKCWYEMFGEEEE